MINKPYQPEHHVEDEYGGEEEGRDVHVLARPDQFDHRRHADRLGADPRDDEQPLVVTAAQDHEECQQGVGGERYLQ